MAVPSKPYATSAQVAYLLPTLLNGSADFDNVSTVPRKSMVEQQITWISNQIDGQFAMAGYVLPFQEISGETWPEYQTQYLQMICALGAAALAGGHILKPAPALQTGRGSSTGNIYQDMYNAELRKIFDMTAGAFGRVTNSTNIRFRALTYSGSAAEHSISEPIGPNLDYMAGMMNPEDGLLLSDYTDLKYAITDYVKWNFAPSYFGWSWTDFFGLYENRLRGYTYASTSS